MRNFVRSIAGKACLIFLLNILLIIATGSFALGVIYLGDYRDIPEGK